MLSKILSIVSGFKTCKEEDTIYIQCIGTIIS